MFKLVLIGCLIGILGGILIPKKRPLLAFISVGFVCVIINFVTDQAYHGLQQQEFGWTSFVIPAAIGAFIAAIISMLRK